jgi:hypothetical protein
MKLAHPVVPLIADNPVALSTAPRLRPFQSRVEGIYRHEAIAQRRDATIAQANSEDRGRPNKLGSTLVSKRIAVSTSEDDTPGRADEALTASTSSKPMLRFSLEIMMAALLMAASYVLRWVAHLIVTEYGVLGGVIACGALYATALIMHRYDL